MSNGTCFPAYLSTAFCSNKDKCLSENHQHFPQFTQVLSMHDSDAAFDRWFLKDYRVMVVYTLEMWKNANTHACSVILLSKLAVCACVLMVVCSDPMVGNVAISLLDPWRNTFTIRASLSDLKNFPHIRQKHLLNMQTYQKCKVEKRNLLILFGPSNLWQSWWSWSSLFISSYQIKNRPVDFITTSSIFSVLDQKGWQ